MTDLKEYFCNKPFEFANIGSPPENLVMSCCWLTKHIGFITENESFLDKWNSAESQEIRKSILNGSFKYCRTDLCPHIQARSLPKKSEIKEEKYRKVIDSENLICEWGPSMVQLNNDTSCNLSCPQCRTHKELIVAGSEFEARKKVFEKSINHELLLQTKFLNITGSGDPFASKLYRDFLNNLDGSIYPELKINLFTNAVLFDEKAWDKLYKIHRNIFDVRISIDASTEDVYRIVRRGGNFEKLKQNIHFICGLKRHGYLNRVTLCFVVQARNYRDMIGLVEYAKTFENLNVHFQKIYNWGTFSDSEFSLHDICSAQHPEHSEFLKLIRHEIFRDPIVDLGNLTSFVKI